METTAIICKHFLVNFVFSKYNLAKKKYHCLDKSLTKIDGHIFLPGLAKEKRLERWRYTVTVYIILKYLTLLCSNNIYTKCSVMLVHLALMIWLNMPHFTNIFKKNVQHFHTKIHFNRNVIQ